MERAEKRGCDSKNFFFRKILKVVLRGWAEIVLRGRIAKKGARSENYVILSVRS